MSTAENLEGATPFGHYELVKRIGAGGMGEVFLARDLRGPEARACVIKKVLPHLQENRQFIGRFQDEARLVVQLHHPHIARVFEMGEVDGEYFLAMEYIKGKTVSRFARRLRELNRPLPLGLALFIGELVCAGLAYAHQARDEHGQALHLVHRDLSPANVCISYEGEVKIIDFGAAQSTLKMEQTAPRIVIGNLSYMAPEQAKKLPIDGRADVYSVGVMLWELITWQAIPQKGDPLERWRRAAHPEWVAPSMFQKGLHPDLDRVLLKALSKSPDGRFLTASELGRSLLEARLAHAPEASRKLLGEWVSQAFGAEKAAEAALLQEVMSQALGKRRVPSAGTAGYRLVPPTALAFEHTAVYAPDALAEEGDGDMTVLDGRGPETSEATPAERPSRLFSQQAIEVGAYSLDARNSAPRQQPYNPTRTSFGFPIEQAPLEPGAFSLVDEIEASHDGEASTQFWTMRPSEKRPLAPRSPTPWPLAAGLFLSAVALGFLAIWIWYSTWGAALVK